MPAMLDRMAQFVVSHVKTLLAVFGILIVCSAGLATQVAINYDLADYVPNDAPSTQAVAVTTDEFSEGVPNVRIYVPNLSVSEALDVKQRIASTPGVTQVLWLDDVVDVRQPLDLVDDSLRDQFYQDGGALFQVAAETTDTTELVATFQDIATDEGAVSGQLVDLALAQSSTSREVTTIMLIMVPMGIALLMLSTHSWLEPPILLVTIGAAVILNLGTNIFLSEISFITQAVTGVLQLAVSMDYGIFLLHARQRYMKRGMGRRKSLRNAIAKSANAIVASSMTTILGFLSLVFMSFRLGPDLGIVLAKGVVFSLVSVLFFMPSLLLATDNLVDKTTHRPLLPSFDGLGKIIAKIAPWTILIAIIFPVAYMAQGSNYFTYGTASYPAESREERDRQFIDDHFGASLQMVLLVPRDEWGRQSELEADLREVDEVKSVTSYLTMVGRQVPSELPPSDQLSSLVSEHYSRIILDVATAPEGEHAFALVDEIRKIAGNHFSDDEFYLVGQSVVTADMKTSITHDNIIVNGLAIASVGFVLLLSFRSIIVPFILVLTIEASIWLNLSVPYVAGMDLSYIGYLIISTVQLGATVDYAILYTQHYNQNRERFGKRDAIHRTTRETFGTLLMPASILTSAGVILALISSMEVISQLGMVLAGGAFASFMMVNIFLPALLYWCDPIIRKLTWKTSWVDPALTVKEDA